VRKGLSLIYDKLRYRLAYRYVVDDIITPAAFIKKQFSRFPWLDQDRIHIIPNGVEIPDTARFDRSKLRRVAGIGDDAPVILGAGRIFSQKGFDYLVEAVAILHAQGTGAHAVIVGGGEEGPVRTLARERGIASYLHLPGHRDDVLELMYGADAFVLSSIDEGLPNAVLEAMSVGTPVVAADAGGTAEIITDGVDGYVVPLRDPGAIAEQAGRLISDGALRKRIGEAGRATVRERFSIGAMVDAVERLFAASLCGQDGRS
jgi:glycosyltransferase involved in cell wall biosynthesis